MATKGTKTQLVTYVLFVVGQQTSFEHRGHSVEVFVYDIRVLLCRWSRRLPDLY